MHRPDIVAQWSIPLPPVLAQQDRRWEVPGFARTEQHSEWLQVAVDERAQGSRRRGWNR